MKFILFLIFLIISVLGVQADTMWDMKELSKAPKVYSWNEPVYGENSWAYNMYLTEEEREYDKTNDSIRGIYYKCVDYQGKETKVFAYIGVPKHQKGTKVPGMVLVHGGGGSAFEAWVRKWNAMGYAAISMDTTGNGPTNEMTGKPTGFGGPGNVFAFDAPVKDQWPYQAVADVILAHSLLASIEDVDKNNIGITGVSWGGYLTCIASSVDSRFKFAIPVYGTGFLYDYSPTVQRDEDTLNKWIPLWDPSIYLKNTKVPITWLVSNVDWCYWLLGVKRSYDVVPIKDKNICIFNKWTHGHYETAGRGEPLAIANYYVNKNYKNNKKQTMPKVLEAVYKDNYLTFTVNVNTDSVVLYWTDDENPKGHSSGDPNQGTKWNSVPVPFNNNKGSVEIPLEAKVFYINAVSKEGLESSSEIYVKQLGIKQ